MSLIVWGVQDGGALEGQTICSVDCTVVDVQFDGNEAVVLLSAGIHVLEEEKSAFRVHRRVNITDRTLQAVNSGIAGYFTNSLWLSINWATHEHASVYKVALSDNHGLFSCSSGLYAFGQGIHGQLGIAESAIAFADVPIKVTLPPGESIRDISVGLVHSMVVTAPHGHVYTFGSGAYYRLGHGVDQSLRVPTLVTSLVGVGQRRPDGSSSGIASCSCSTWHCLVLTQDTAEVWGWGWNKFGQLGVSEAEMIVEPQRLTALELFTATAAGDDDDIVQLSCGVRHSAFRTASGKVAVMGHVGLTTAVVPTPSITADAVEQDLRWLPLPVDYSVSSMSSYRWSLACIAHHQGIS